MSQQYDSPLERRSYPIYPRASYGPSAKKKKSKFLTDICSMIDDWNRQPIGDYGPVLRNIDTDIDRLGSSYGSSNNSASLLDPRYHYSPHSDALSLNTNISRRLSDTASMSSGEALMSASDVSFYSDSPYEPSPYEGSPYEGSIMSDYTHRSGLAISNSSTPLSPLMSPHQTSHMSMRSGGRGRASPSPSRSGMGVRAAPYSAAERNTSKRWSTGSYIAGPQSQTSSPYTNEMNLYQLPPNLNSHSHHSSPTCSTGCPPPPQQMLLSHSSGFSSGRSSSSNSNGYAQNPYVDDHSCPPMPSHLLVKMLQSNAAEHYRSHRADQSDPPDLYASLMEDQVPPPQEDMNPLDPDLKPHEQDLRFEGDLYTPRWVRGHGNKREGWCGICKPGRWLVLKNSAFWYDKSFTHGISAATGQRFVEPKSVRRMEGNPDVWEGLCHSCSEWVALVSNKKKGTTWFRHAYKVIFFFFLFWDLLHVHICVCLYYYYCAN